MVCEGKGSLNVGISAKKKQPELRNKFAYPDPIINNYHLIIIDYWVCERLRAIH